MIRRPWHRGVVGGLLAGCLLAVGVHAGQLILRRNFHALVPGRVYRSAQLPPDEMRDMIRARGIRTVVNLRGESDPMDWYLDECRVTHEAGIAQEDVNLSACRLPGPDDVRYVVRLLDRTEYPILIHCRHGADRTGLVSGIYLLLYTAVEPGEAAMQASIRYGHVALGKTAFMDRFFTLYTDWLAEHGERHSPELFRHWAECEYCPGASRGTLEFTAFPNTVVTGKPWSVRVRAHNTSERPWRFCPGITAGHHIAYVISDGGSQQLTVGRAGLRRADVSPGESIDVTVALPAVHRAGKYRLTLDLVDEQHCWFYQVGSEPLEQEFEVSSPRDRNR